MTNDQFASIAAMPEKDVNRLLAKAVLKHIAVRVAVGVGVAVAFHMVEKKLKSLDN